MLKGQSKRAQTFEARKFGLNQLFHHTVVDRFIAFPSLSKNKRSIELNSGYLCKVDCLAV